MKIPSLPGVAVPKVLNSRPARPCLVVTVPGTPRPQGSLRIIQSRSTGKAFAKNSDTTIEHRNLVTTIMVEKWGSRDMLRGPVAARMVFRFARPKSHFGTGKNAEKLKDSAPSRHIRTPDTDKLVRLVDDALVAAGVINDDSQVCLLRAEKEWQDNRSESVIEVFEL